MIENSRCPYEAGSQLGDAVEFLDAHPGEVALITINLGANDIFEDCEGDPSCFIPQIATNLPFILETLRDHAGPGVPIVGMSYYALTSSSGSTTLRPARRRPSSVMFNNFLGSLYAGAGVPVADVESAFAVTDFTTMVDLQGAGPFLSVFNACTLTWLCTPPPLGPDVHPNNDGYGVIAQAFATTLRPLADLPERADVGRWC